MSTNDRKLACHHIELEKGCMWCDVYQHQSVRNCDRCRNTVNTDLVYLSIKSNNPELLCIYCHHDEQKWG